MQKNGAHNKLIKLLIVNFCFTTLPLMGSTISTPAQSAAAGLKDAIEIYAKNHQGELPKSWDSLNNFFLKRESPTSPGPRSFIFSSLDGLAGGSVEEAFLLVQPTDIKMFPRNSDGTFSVGNILAVITSPIFEDRRKEVGRYVIWRDNKQNFRTSWLNEATVEARFLDAKANLPMRPVLQQPSSLGPQGEIQKYSQDNFKDPKNPTGKEIEKMKQYFAKEFSEKSTTAAVELSELVAAGQSSAPSLSGSNSSFSVSQQKPKPAIFAILLWLLLGLMLAGAAVFILRWKK